MSVPYVHENSLEHSLVRLRSFLGQVKFPLREPHAQDAEGVLRDILAQLDDYIVPRLSRLDAPLVAVVGGSTGSGKSTLVNALVGENYAQVSAIRPTTRHPLLLHSAQDRQWFESDRILPGFVRVRGAARSQNDRVSAKESSSAVNELELVQSDRLSEGLALVDAPDIDSVVEENRKLAAQLMAAADIWLFVTTAARYADAIPWAMLDEAASRNIVVAVVLNRIPPGVGVQVRADLARRLDERGLRDAPLFTIAERSAYGEEKGEGRSGANIPDEDIAPIRGWLEQITYSSAARMSVARQSVLGAIGVMGASCDQVVEALDEQDASIEAMRASIHLAEKEALNGIAEAIDEGKLLRGEVLHHWNGLVRTGNMMRSLESKVSSVREKVGKWFKGAREVPFSRVEEDISDLLVNEWVAESESAIRHVKDAWRAIPGASVFADQAFSSVRTQEEREAEARSAVFAWRKRMAHMVANQGERKLAKARVLSVGVNAVGAALMIVVFAASAGVTGGEAVIAGGTAVVAQRLLEAVFGDEAVRVMARQAREELLESAQLFVAEDMDAFKRKCEEIAVPGDLSRKIREVQHDVERHYHAERKR